MKIKKLLPFLALAILLIAGIYQLRPTTPKQTQITIQTNPAGPQTKPDEYMYNMRAYPNNHIDEPSFRNAVKQRKLMLADNNQRSVTAWNPVGPNNIGGRITDMAYHPTDASIIFAGSSVGGIFKSENFGVSWDPIFDDSNSPSIGNIAISTSDPNIIFVGTGEANGSATTGAFFGDGIYKSIDGGDTWEKSGLDNSQHIGRIVIDALNPDRVYVATAGLLYGKSDDRGLYRTLDGGTTWENVLFISDSTSCIDVAIHPQNADIVYAATWERTRRPWGRDYGGVTSGLWRSTDGGENWEQLTNGLPPSDEDTGRIGVAISASNPNILYTTFTTNSITNIFDGLYKSIDGGDTWNLINDEIDNVFSSFGWFFGNIRVNPNNPDDLFVLGVPLYRSTDGGISFEDVTDNMHVDFHALEFHPIEQDRIVLGCDGGIYRSINNGGNFVHEDNLPNIQFYNCEIDESNPTRYFGGAQDNGTLRTVDGDPDDYNRIFGGDGFHVAVNPINSDVVYAEYQWGNLSRSLDGGNSFQSAMNGISSSDRTNWNTPFIIDHSNPTHLYYGSERVYKTVNQADFWQPISGDLTKGEHPSGSQSFGTITTIAVAPTNSNFILAGTDDGNIQLTTNGGDDWENINNGLPERTVSKVAFDPNDETIMYVTLSGYRFVDYIPHVLRSVDNGQTWEDISGNLPEIPVNDIIIDPLNPSSLVIANDIGVFITYNEGNDWELLGTGLPLTVATDLRFHAPTRKLLVATFGRSMYTYQLQEPVTTQDQKLANEGKLKVYPNPVVDQAVVEFELSKQKSGQLQLLNLNGQVIKTIQTGNFGEGMQRIQWNAGDLVTGMYILRLDLSDQVLIQKVNVN